MSKGLYIDQFFGMDNQEVAMDVEAQIENNNDDRTLPFSIFKKANLPITLKVNKSIYSLIHTL